MNTTKLTLQKYWGGGFIISGVKIILDYVYYVIAQKSLTLHTHTEIVQGHYSREIRLLKNYE